MKIRNQQKRKKVRDLYLDLKQAIREMKIGEVHIVSQADNNDKVIEAMSGVMGRVIEHSKKDKSLAIQ